MKALGLIFIAFFSCTACSQSPISADNKAASTSNSAASATNSSAAKTRIDEAVKPAQQLDTVIKKIDQMKMDVSCDSSTQCIAVGIGSAACGGPTSYILHSSNAGQDAIDQLNALAKQSSLIEKKLNSQSGLAGICQYNSPPAMACVNNKCVVSNQGITE